MPKDKQVKKPKLGNTPLKKIDTLRFQNKINLNIAF